MLKAICNECNVTNLLRTCSVWHAKISVGASFPGSNTSSQSLLLFWGLVPVKVYPSEGIFRDTGTLTIGNTFENCQHIRGLEARLESHKIIIFSWAYHFLLCFLSLGIYPCMSLGPLLTLGSVLVIRVMCVKYSHSWFAFLSSANTSCGLPLKMLRKTPIYTCGTYLVMLVPPPGGSGSSATRSLFGGTSGLSSLKSKWILFWALFPICLQLWNLRLFCWWF